MHILFFGEYEWTKRDSPLLHPHDHLSYVERLDVELGREWWKDETVDERLPKNVTRAKTWAAVVEWMRENAISK